MTPFRAVSLPYIPRASGRGITEHGEEYTDEPHAENLGITSFGEKQPKRQGIRMPRPSQGDQSSVGIIPAKVLQPWKEGF